MAGKKVIIRTLDIGADKQIDYFDTVSYTHLCTSYTSGSFEAEVMDVSEYPVTGNSVYGSSNPNVSYYAFTAVVSDKTLMLCISPAKLFLIDKRRFNYFYLKHCIE